MANRWTDYSKWSRSDGHWWKKKSQKERKGDPYAVCEECGAWKYTRKLKGVKCCDKCGTKWDLEVNNTKGKGQATDKDKADDHDKDKDKDEREGDEAGGTGSEVPKDAQAHRKELVTALGTMLKRVSNEKGSVVFDLKVAEDLQDLIALTQKLPVDAAPTLGAEQQESHKQVRKKHDQVTAKVEQTLNKIKMKENHIQSLESKVVAAKKEVTELKSEYGKLVEEEKRLGKQRSRLVRGRGAGAVEPGDGGDAISVTSSDSGESLSVDPEAFPIDPDAPVGKDPHSIQYMFKLSEKEAVRRSKMERKMEASRRAKLALREATSSFANIQVALGAVVKKMKKSFVTIKMEANGMDIDEEGLATPRAASPSSQAGVDFDDDDVSINGLHPNFGPHDGGHGIQEEVGQMQRTLALTDAPPASNASAVASFAAASGVAHTEAGVGGAGEGTVPGAGKGDGKGSSHRVKPYSSG